jgi:ABC-type branched-subunit amino acid transport system ATPase component
MHVDPVIETHILTKRYGTRIVAVDNLHLTIQRGEVYGFLGPNGSNCVSDGRCKCWCCLSFCLF